MFGEGLIDDIDASVGAAEQKFTINFSKAKTKFCLSLHYNHHNIHLFFNVKKIFNKNVDFPTEFCLGSISNKFDANGFEL